ncbi:hypothetical protein MMC25_002426 [Agyrium rufum]|nr:hypothetical protein [Agyrium rufum]
MILLTALALAESNAKLLQGTNSPDIPLPKYLQIPDFPLNLGTIAALIYCGLYLLLEPIAGALVTPIILGSTAYANHLLSVDGSTPANYAFIGIHIFGWLAQFIGHGVFEGRAPALLDNLIQAIFLAPFFVWMEVLFALGYRPELKGRLDKEVEKEVAKVKTEKERKKNLKTASDGNASQIAMNGNGQVR